MLQCFGHKFSTTCWRICCLNRFAACYNYKSTSKFSCIFPKPFGLHWQVAYWMSFKQSSWTGSAWDDQHLELAKLKSKGCCINCVEQLETNRTILWSFWDRTLHASELFLLYLFGEESPITPLYFTNKWIHSDIHVPYTNISTLLLHYYQDLPGTSKAMSCHNSFTSGIWFHRFAHC